MRMYTPKLYSKATVYRYFYYYDYYGPKKILEDYRNKESSATEQDYFDALNNLLKEKGYVKAKEGNEWFKKDFTYKTERITPCYTYEQEDGTKESVKVLHFTLMYWSDDNVSYEILFHLPYYIKLSDRCIYLTELIESVLTDMEKEMSSIVPGT
nr:MAG TPA: hypothetical protein [Caudoviricetes sp.]